MQTSKTYLKKYYRELSVKTLSDVYQAKGTELSLIRKEYGEPAAKAILAFTIADVVEFFNVGKKMGQNQLVDTVNLILEEYYWFKLEDFNLCFKMAKKGVFGTTYDRMDGAVIFEWLNTYAAKRELYYASIEDERKKDESVSHDVRIKESVSMREALSEDSIILKLAKPKK